MTKENSPFSKQLPRPPLYKSPNLTDIIGQMSKKSPKNAIVPDVAKARVIAFEKQLAREEHWPKSKLPDWSDYDPYSNDIAEKDKSLNVGALKFETRMAR